VTTTEPSNPFRKPGYLAAAIVVGVIVLAAIIVLVTSLAGGGDEPDAPPATAAAPTPTGSANPADESVCGLEGFEEKTSLDGPPENEWELVGTVAAPIDYSGAGPGVIEQNGFRSCYARTAEGALFAAVGYVAVSSDIRNLDRIPELLAAGPVRDELEQTPPPAEAPSDSRLQVAGFKINSYTADEATVDVVYQVTSENGALMSLPTVIKWEDGDWKVVITENGPPFAPSQVQNLGGYIPWAGV
jgi:hypothetical protein